MFGFTTLWACVLLSIILIADLKYENLMKKLSFFSENILSTSLDTACMGTKRQRECSLNCYKHWRSFPIREWVSYHLEVVVVVLDDLFILTGKSQISMVTPGFVTKVRLNQKCLKPLHHYKPLSSHCGWNLTLTLLFPPGQESTKVVYYFSQPWFLCRVQNDCKVWDLLVRAKSKRNLRAGVELEKDYQIFLWGFFHLGKSLAACFRLSFKQSLVPPM